MPLFPASLFACVHITSHMFSHPCKYCSFFADNLLLHTTNTDLSPTYLTNHSVSTNPESSSHHLFHHFSFSYVNLYPPRSRDQHNGGPSNSAAGAQGGADHGGCLGTYGYCYGDFSSGYLVLLWVGEGVGGEEEGEER